MIYAYEKLSTFLIKRFFYQLIIRIYILSLVKPMCLLEINIIGEESTNLFVRLNESKDDKKIYWEF